MILLETVPRAASLLHDNKPLVTVRSPVKSLVVDERLTKVELPPPVGLRSPLSVNVIGPVPVMAELTVFSFPLGLPAAALWRVNPEEGEMLMVPPVRD